eukprot:1364426-Rhodomonas_salina.2
MKALGAHTFTAAQQEIKHRQHHLELASSCLLRLAHHLNNIHETIPSSPFNTPTNGYPILSCIHQLRKQHPQQKTPHPWEKAAASLFRN